MEKKTFLVGVVTGALLATVILKSPAPAMPQMTVASGDVPPGVSTVAPVATPTAPPAATPTPQGLVQVADVLPDHADLGVSFGDAVVKMVQGGAIDKAKFVQLYESRQPLSAQEKQLLDAPSRQHIVINPGNAGLLLNLLWPLGIANKSAALSKGPLGTQFKDQVGNLAATGGWTLGQRDGAALFNSLPLISLTPAQEATVTNIAQHVYRPCCNNPTAMPDCNHGAAMLGFIELAVAQGMSASDVYRKALVLNSYWFPQNYVEIATFLKARQGADWKGVDPKQVLDAAYSSGRGFGAVDAELQTMGLLPKVNGGGSCGA
jgi:hypothetical protein